MVVIDQMFIGNPDNKWKKTRKAEIFRSKLSKYTEYEVHTFCTRQ